MAIIIAVFTPIAVLQVKKLVKNKDWKGLVVFGLLMIAAFALSILKVLNVEIPDPVQQIKIFIDNVRELF